MAHDVLHDAYRNDFLRRLARVDQRRARAVDAIARLERAYGVQLVPELREYFEVYGRHRMLEEFGHFQPFDEDIFPLPDPSAGNLFVQALRDPAMVLGAFLGGVPLGSDGGSNHYYVAIDPDHAEVAVYARGLGSTRLLARSLSAFAGLNRLSEVWGEHVHRNDIDDQSVLDGDQPVDLGQPDLAEVAELLEVLRGNVNLIPEHDVHSDFDELFAALSGDALRASSNGCWLDDHQRAEWVVARLTHCGWPSPRQVTEPPERAFVGRASEALYWLWHAFFLEQEREVRRGLKEAATHPAAIVRDAAVFIEDLLDAPMRYPEWSHLRVRSTMEPAARLRFDRSLIAPVADDDDRIELYKRLLTEDERRSDVWDNLTYLYFEREDWQKMAACAEVSIAVQPRAYYAHMQRGVAALLRDEYRPALDAFDHALCFGDHANLWLNKAIAWLALGNQDAALAQLRQLPAPNRAALIRAVDELAPLRTRPEFRVLIGEA